MNSTSNMTFGRLNARGICVRKKQAQLRRLLMDEGIGILTLQETKLAYDHRIRKVLEPFLSEYEACISHAVVSSAECSLLLKKCVPLWKSVL